MANEFNVLQSEFENLCNEFSSIKSNNEFKSISDGNVFSVLDIIRKEVMYCRVLVYLLRNNWHLFEENVLKKCCDGEELVTAETEFPCDPPCDDYQKEGRIDIFLKTQSHVVAIEVKVDAGDQEHQLIRYQKELEKSFKEYKHHIFYLTLDGHSPSEYSLKCNQNCNKNSNNKCVVENYNCISFNSEICNWLQNIIPDFEEHSIAKDFLEVLKMNNNNYQEYVELLRHSKEYSKMILKLSEAIPSFFAEVREAFFNDTAKVLKERYGFQDDKSPHEYNREVWPVNLKKGEKHLHFCYETNFFFRTGIGDDEWRYLKAVVFKAESEENDYLSRKPSEAFNIKKMDASSFGLIDWYLEKDNDRGKRIIEHCAQAADTFVSMNDNISKIGPFFYIHGKLIYNACPLVEGREQAGKLDNSYGHDQLYDDHFKSGEYIDYPRGRVLWDEEKNHSIIFIDPCIHRDNVLSQIIDAFDIGDYVVEYDDHYHCKKCVGDLFN